MAKFFLRTNKKTGIAPLYVRHQKNGANILLNTKVFVNIIDWNNSQANISKWKNYVQTSEGARVYKYITQIEQVLETNTETNADVLANAIALIVNEEQAQREQAQSQKADEERKRAIIEAEKARKANILAYTQEMISQMQLGIIKTKSGRNYEKHSIENYKTTYTVLSSFVDECYFTWNDIDKKLAQRFVLFLESKNFLDETINAYISYFLFIVRSAYNDNYHDNYRACEILANAKRVIRTNRKKAEIYLTEKELNALYEMPLKGTRARVRDAFLCGCYSCQRYSDYDKLNESNIYTTAKGNKVFKFTQEKTNAEIIVPILNDKLINILKRNFYNFDVVNKTNTGHFNLTIRNIMRELSLSVPSLCELYETMPTYKELAQYEKGEGDLICADNKYYKPKYALVTSHTARRSGITNLYLSGRLNDLQMMSISGHKTQKIFREYIKLSNEEIANEIIEIWEKKSNIV